MDALINLMNKLLADSFTLYLKSHYYHWNVEGKDFPQYHDFLGDFYQEVWAAVDDIAEHIRQLDAYSPGTLARFKELTSITETTTLPSNAEEMFKDLYAQNKALLASLTPVYKMSEQFSEFGLSNFIQDRMMAHKKHDWMLRSILKDKGQ